MSLQIVPATLSSDLCPLLSEAKSRPVGAERSEVPRVPTPRGRAGVL